jgi:hypothetical protein
LAATSPISAACTAKGVSGTSLLNNNADNYYASRLRIDLGFEPTSWLRFFAERQHARVGAYNTAPAPDTLYLPLDLRQGYVELKFEGTPNVRFRAGRQELAFGGERLIGPGNFHEPSMR